MEPENIDWDNIDSTFIVDDTYENFDAPKWFDFSASSNELLVNEDDDEIWFCTHDCNHPKIAQDFLKPTTINTTNSKAKLLRFGSFSEILPFRERKQRENSSVVKHCEKSARPNCLRNMDEDIENKNPNFVAKNFNVGTNKLKKPLLRQYIKRDNLNEMNGSKECHVRSNGKSRLKSTFSAQNLLGGREILSQITGFCSELKRLATWKGSTKKGGGNNEKGANSNGVLEELKEKTKGSKERMPLLVVKEGTLP
ncbi:uncharacterized protein LOC123888373 [Trifolium pratense]|nr:uncharacterized protein LOC123888373 [Trifolium pratense]